MSAVYVMLSVVLWHAEKLINALGPVYFQLSVLHLSRTITKCIPWSSIIHFDRLLEK